MGTLWGLDEIDQPAVQQFFDSLNRVRKRTGCAIALIGHDNRKGDYRGLALIHNNVQSRIHLKPTREQDDEDEPVTDITIRHRKQRAGALIRPIPFTVTWSAHRIALTSTATHAGKLEHVVRYIQDAGGELVPTRTLTTQFGLGRNWVSDHADMLHACSLERDNEVDPRQSSGWRIRLPQDPQNSDPSHRDRSTIRVCDLPGETPQTPKDRITMRVCDLPGDVPPTGVSNTPPQGRVERGATATPIDPEVDVPSDSELAILAELDEMVAKADVMTTPAMLTTTISTMLEATAYASISKADWDDLTTAIRRDLVDGRGEEAIVEMLTAVLGYVVSVQPTLFSVEAES